MRAGSVVAIALVLVACRGRDTPPLIPADPPTPMATRGAAQSTLLDSGSTTLAGFGSRWTGDLDAMIDRRYIRALVTPSRTGYFVEAGAPHGISWEFLNAFEQDLNRRLPTGAKVRILYVPVPRDQLVRGLVEGRGDVAVAQITVTPGREQRVDFSTPIAEGVRELVVTSATGRPVNKPSDLSGREVFVRRSSSYWEHLVTLNRALEAEGKPPVRLRAAPEHLDDEDILELVNAGVVHVTVADDFLAQLWARVLPSIRVQQASLHDNGVLAWAFRKRSPQLKQAVDRFVATHHKGTAFGNTVLRRYTAQTTFVRSPTQAGERRKFEEMVHLFRRYGKQYDLDFLLMMAQGYQESRLDQKVVSNAGAIGVMQVMPKTGKEMNVGDIRQVEPNIHAGVKYMRTMMDKYFPAETADSLNRTLFAFAAYNAGPARVRTWRQEAGHRGLDPNIWFDNVEVLAAESIGPETVTYVGNIFKYYVAYHLLAEEMAARDSARKGVH